LQVRFQNTDLAELTMHTFNKACNLIWRCQKNRFIKKQKATVKGGFFMDDKNP
jgi:hypothetical protein